MWCRDGRVAVSTSPRLLDAEETDVSVVNNTRLVVAESPDEPLDDLDKTDTLHVNLRFSCSACSLV